MRESFEAKLAAASELAKDRQAAHRREIRCVSSFSPSPWFACQSRIAPSLTPRACHPSHCIRRYICMHSELREAYEKERAVMESRIAYLAAKVPQ